jgi:predicted nucleic acid-binding Zn ribbon protein
MDFVRCRNCNVYIEKNSAFGDFFCSSECSLQFKCCPVCGKYFPAGEDDYCSDECRKNHDDTAGDRK